MWLFRRDYGSHERNSGPDECGKGDHRTGSKRGCDDGAKCNGPKCNYRDKCNHRE